MTWQQDREGRYASFPVNPPAVGRSDAVQLLADPGTLAARGNAGRLFARQRTRPGEPSMSDREGPISQRDVVAEVIDHGAVSGGDDRLVVKNHPRVDQLV